MACIEFTTTSVCNYGCKYCFEGHGEQLDKSRIQKAKTTVTAQEAVNFVNRYMEEICPEDPNIELSFWGGEPFLNFDFIEDVVLALSNDRRVHFMMYTNGHFIKRYQKRIKTMADACNNRLYIQISYDGISHDIMRVDKGGNPTSAETLEAYKILKNLGIPTGFKSVIMPETYKYLFDNFIDIAITRGEGYNPSNDSHNLVSAERANQYLDDLKANLIKIAKYIFDNNLDPEKFEWFSKSRKMCRAGYRFVTVDVDGTLFPCHGFMYIGDDYRYCNIRDVNCFRIIKEHAKELENPVKLGHPNGECEHCNVEYCVRCPAGSATISKDLELTKAEHYAFINRFTCSVFKLNHQIAEALHHARFRNRPN